MCFKLFLLAFWLNFFVTDTVTIAQLLQFGTCFKSLDTLGEGGGLFNVVDSNTVQPLNLDICVAWVK